MSDRDLFLTALDKPDPAAHAAAHADSPAQRERVAALLAAHAAAGGFLERPAADPAPTAAAPDGPPTTDFRPTATDGTVLAGRYKLVERIGEGGMGSVWMARQTEPVKRLVAVKLIKTGADTAAVVARFDAERQALAVMDHPNIARVFDADVSGTTPFFVMELVKGVPITKYCDDRKLTPRQRLELFVPVCQAIQHAHQKGVIHRDIKPSNVLVALYDDRPVPKVIDFGVAKATGAKLTDATLHTGFGAVVGTPEYMSPEQASLNNLDIDTRSDVYALGVLLYELLTGSTPVDRKALGQAALLEVLRIVREVEAPRPSAKLSSSAALPGIAAARGTEPARLSKLLRGELDWVVLKALEKDRTRRYDTANGLARDVLRYLADEVVEARPPSVGYRARKFVRRNRAAVWVAAAFLFLTYAGASGIYFAYQRAVTAEAATAAERDRAEDSRRAAAHALADKTAEERAKTAALAVAAKNLADRDTARKQTVAALLRLTDEFVVNQIARQPALTEDNRRFLRDVLALWRTVSHARGDDPLDRELRGRGAVQVAHVLKLLGETVEAEAAYRAALGVLARLAADHPANPDFRHNLANTQSHLGLLLSGAGRQAEAEPLLRTAADTHRRLVADHPTDPAYRGGLSADLGALGSLLARSGRRDEAKVEYRAALEVDAGLVADFPADTDIRYRMGNIRHLLGAVLFDTEPEVAEREFRTAVGIHQRLVAEHPAKTEFRNELAATRNDLGGLLFDRKRPDEAETEWRAALDQWERLTADYPAVPVYGMNLGAGYVNLGNLLGNARTPADGLEWHAKGIALLELIHARDRGQVLAKRLLCLAHGNRAIALGKLGRHTEALKDWDAALGLAAEQDPFRHDFRLERAVALAKDGRRAAEAVAEVEGLVRLPGWTPVQRYDFACVLALAGGQVADKRAEYADRAMALLTKAVAAGYTDRGHLETDTDLDALRGRADFRKLLASLPEAAPPPRPGVIK